MVRNSSVVDGLPGPLSTLSPRADCVIHSLVTSACSPVCAPLFPLQVAAGCAEAGACYLHRSRRLWMSAPWCAPVLALPRGLAAEDVGVHAAPVAHWGLL